MRAVVSILPTNAGSPGARPFAISFMLTMPKAYHTRVRRVNVPEFNWIAWKALV